MSGFYSAHSVLLQTTVVDFILALSVYAQFRAGVFSVAGIGSYGLGAYTTAILLNRESFSTGLAVLLAVVLSAVASGALGVLLRRLVGLYLAMATIAYVLILSVVANNGGSLTGGEQGLFGIIPTPNFAVMSVIAVLLAVVCARSERGRFRRRVEAVRVDPEMATALGINTAAYRSRSFVISGALGGLAGGLGVIVQASISPADFGFSLVTLILVIVVVGGAQTWWGVAIGAIVFTWFTSVTGSLGVWSQALEGLLVILVALYAPGGLAGALRQAWRAWAPASARARLGAVLPRWRPSRRARTERLLRRRRSRASPIEDGIHPVLAVDDVSVHYGGVRAVDGVTIQLSPGLIYGILGPNGSGKSTLLGAVSRLVPIQSGSMALHGQEFERWAPHQVGRHGLSRTFQAVRLMTEMSVRDNIELGFDLRATQSSARAGSSSMSREIVSEMGLEAVMDKLPGELSYGVQRRVEIARAVASEPRLLVLDEPGAGMNSIERQAVVELLDRLRSRGMTILLVEHDVELMTKVCDKLFALNSGKLIAAGNPEEVVRDEVVREAYLGTRAIRSAT